jgi:hypothetical protein
MLIGWGLKENKMKKSLLVRMWKFTFPYIDIRLTGLAGLTFGLMIAKIWEPILYLDWYWYLIIALLAGIKPMMTFWKQV